VSRGSALWIAAVAATAAAGWWQWRTGPSNPYRARVSLGGAVVRVALPRSHETTSPAHIALPAVRGAALGTLSWRRFASDAPFTASPLRPDGEALVAALPAQPHGARVEYYVELTADAGSVRIPARPPQTVVLRFHDPIPASLLVAHIAVMFLAMLLGVRAGLAALWETSGQLGLTLLALTALTVGGFALGPLVQKAGFGTYWTGVPFGWDLTDNKTLVAWIGWAAAAVAAQRRCRSARWVVALAVVIMLAAFLVPHSAVGG
jgi:hypothetical protein